MKALNGFTPSAQMEKQRLSKEAKEYKEGSHFEEPTTVILIIIQLVLDAVMKSCLEIPTSDAQGAETKYTCPVEALSIQIEKNACTAT